MDGGVEDAELAVECKALQRTGLARVQNRVRRPVPVMALSTLHVCGSDIVSECASIGTLCRFELEATSFRLPA